MIAGLFLLAAVTFHQDVEPILQKKCQSCHRPGEIGPMPLLTYQQARPWAKAIRQAVVLKKMPPWYASGGGPFRNNPELTPKEIQTFEAWVEAGAPRGASKDAPRPVSWPDGWNIPSPDLVVSATRPFPVPASGAVDYQFVILPLRTLEDHWVTAAEIRPGARSAVHHIVAYIREPDSPWLKDAPRNQAFRAQGVTTSDILAIYTPGQAPFQALPGMAKKLRAGSELVLQFHYTPNGKSEMDQTSVGMVFTDKPPVQRVLTLQMGNAEFHIPPGDPNYRVTVGGTMPNDALLLSMFPHMHLRGKAFEYEVTAEGGRAETLLRVAPYSFQWQLSYVLAKPRLLRKGTHLRFTAWFDNSASNPFNPDPAKEVSYGEQSWDEMMIGFFDVAVDPRLDKSAFFVR